MDPLILEKCLFTAIFNNYIPIFIQDDYMNAKKIKLEEQFKHEAELSGIQNNIFRGTSIFVNGYTS